MQESRRKYARGVEHAKRAKCEDSAEGVGGDYGAKKKCLTKNSVCMTLFTQAGSEMSSSDQQQPTELEILCG